MADQENTTFFQRAGGKLQKHKALVTSGTGLSAAALIYLHGVFATKTEVLKLQQSQATQWQQISDLKAQVDQLKGQNAAYELLLNFINVGKVSFDTNQIKWTPR